MKQIKLLDCTLRDGGSVNKWNFGTKNIFNIMQQLNDANIDVIEVGFLQDNEGNNQNRSTSENPCFFNKKIESIKNKKAQFYAMIDFGKFDINKLQNKKFSSIDGIRLMSKKQHLMNALNVLENIKEKGYKVSINPVSVTTYTYKEYKELTKSINDIEPSIIYIVDTYGLMNRYQTMKYFEILNSNLKSNIAIGYHCHNNLQLAFSNAIEIINAETERNIIIDGSLYGMGKRAGNTNTELIADYLNQNKNANYDIDKISNIIEQIIAPIKNDFDWGYSQIHYTAAINKCHSDYVSYLYKEKSLSFAKINKILPLIDENRKLTFDKEHIDSICSSNT